MGIGAYNLITRIFKEKTKIDKAITIGAVKVNSLLLGLFGILFAFN